ncbi:MAG: DinB family protein [Saprospiraceae bacterium]|nr:DinB family protein [Saprospiraceae bacterium]
MEFSIDKSLEILERTPAVLSTMLVGLSDDWTMKNEGGETWSPFDVIGHLIHGEQTDWIPRMKQILELGTSEPFAPFDRNAQFEVSKGKNLDQLLQDFTRLRQVNLRILKDALLDDDALSKQGIHPALGVVTLKQLLSCWTVHDLGHIHQISRVMAKQYSTEVGPWIAYLAVVGGR